MQDLRWRGQNRRSGDRSPPPGSRSTVPVGVWVRIPQKLNTYMLIIITVMCSGRGCMSSCPPSLRPWLCTRWMVVPAELIEERLGIIDRIVVRPTFAVPPDIAGGRRCRQRVSVLYPADHPGRRRGAGLRGAEHREARAHPVQRVLRLRRTDSDGEDHQGRRTRCQGPQWHVRPVRQNLAAARQKTHAVDQHQAEKPQPAME